MTVPATTVTPASIPDTASVAAPVQQEEQEKRDTFGKKGLKLEDIPITGHVKGGVFTPAGEQSPDDGSVKVGDRTQPDTNVAEQLGEDGKPVVSVPTTLKAKNGRGFKDSAELLATYDNSSTEAMRLASESKTQQLMTDDLTSKLQEANATILNLQQYVGNGSMPDAKSEEQLAAMTEDERFNYRLEKREWTKKIDAFKQQMATVKADSEALSARVKAEIAHNEQVMTANTTKYPEYAETAPLRAEILKESPYLANRTDSPYVSYYIALGVMALREKEQIAALEVKSRQDAEAKARSEAAVGGGGAPSADKPTPTPRDEHGLQGMVAAAKKLKGSW